METKYQIGDIVAWKRKDWETPNMETIFEIADDGSYCVGHGDFNSFSCISDNEIVRLIAYKRENPIVKSIKCHRYGGNKEDYSRYINSYLWKRKKAKIIERDNHKCQVCGKTGLLHVHHISYDRFDHENDSDLITLCPDCHDLIHYFGDKAEYLFDKHEISGTDKFPIPIMASFAIMEEEFKSKIPENRADFLSICILTMFGQSFRKEGIMFFPIDDEFRGIFGLNLIFCLPLWK